MNTMNLAISDLETFSVKDLQLLARNNGIDDDQEKQELVQQLAQLFSFVGKTVLVTGGAGFIGSNLVDALLREGAKVRVLDNLSTGKMDNLRDAFRSDNFIFINGDIRDLDTCKKACEGCDIVYHEAALVSVPKSMEDPILNNDININGALNMLIAAASAGVHRFVYASSAAIYGEDPEIPKREDMPRHYPSPYALSKGVDEDYATLFAYKNELGHGMTCVGLRYFNVYGPRQDPKSPYSGVISIFTDRIKAGQGITIFGDGMQTRDFVFVQDVVQANLIAGLMRLNKDESRIYNVASGKTVTLLDLLTVIKGILGKEVDVTFGPARAGDIRHSSASINKISKMGYKSKYDLREGLERLLSE